MKILITGSAGFIGFNFAKHLLRKTRHQVIGIDNLNDYYSIKIKKERLRDLSNFKKFKFFKIDLNNKVKIDKLFQKKIDIVFHFAAQAGVRYSLKNPRAYIDSNLGGFFNIIENIKKHKIKKFFYASSSSVYGDSKKFPLKEIDKINPRNIYGLTKKTNEEMVEVFFKNIDINCFGLRFFTVFGEWGRPDMLIFQYLQSIFNPKKIFYLNNFGNHTRDFTYIQDVCDVMYRLMNKKLPKHHDIFNICSNKPIKITSVLKYIDSNFFIKPKIKKRKFQLADVKKTHGQNKKINRFVNKNKFFHVINAIDNTCNWYKNNWKIYN